MIEKLDQSSGRVLGFRIEGTVDKSDYALLVPAVEELVNQQGTISLLLDLTGFKWEKVSAWGADMSFGHEFRKKIDRMAIVGDKKWEQWLAKLASPFYADEARFFQSEDIDSAWDWLRE